MPDDFDQADEQEDIDEESYSDVDEAVDLMSRYWASQEDPKKLWQTLCDKTEEFYSALDRRGLPFIQNLAYSMYFGMNTTSGGRSGSMQTQSIRFGGKDGELMELSINEIRSYFDQICDMQTKNRPSFQAQALNTDYDSMAQVESSDTLVQYYYEQVYGERKEKEVVKGELLYGKAYTHIEWDADGGPDVEISEEIQDEEVGALPSKQTVKAGEFIISRVYMWDVVCEPYRSEYDGQNWRLVNCAPMSKYEAMARWPVHAGKLDKSECRSNSWAGRFPGVDQMGKVDEDMCSKAIFYHAKTAAMPKGRRVVFINDVLVVDEELPIDVIPVHALMSCELHGTSWGISSGWNLIPAEQLQNQILSDVATNIEAFGRPPIAITEGTDIDLDSLANGQKVLFLPPNTQMPEAVKFPQVPDVSFKVLQLMREFKQSLSGLNAVARGDTSANVTSGAHAALYSQQAVEAQSARAAELDLMREAIGNMLLMFLKKYAKHPQMVAIVGKDERAYLQTFTGADLQGVQKVVVKTANPALRTAAGRLQIAQLLSDWPGMPLSDPRAVIDLVTTGQMLPMYSGTRASELHSKWENEELLKAPQVQQVPGEVDPMTGQPAMNETVPAVPVLATENATEHIRKHLEIVYSPAAQKNPAIKKAALVHILEHVRISRTADPYMAQLLGNPGPQQPDPAQGGPQPAGANGSGGTAPEQKSANQALKDPQIDDTNDKNGGNLPSPAAPAKAPGL